MSQEEKYRDPEAEQRRRDLFAHIPRAPRPEEIMRDRLKRLAEQITADKPKQGA